MMPPADEVLAKALAVLKDQVLPELPSASWTAANVRSCINLLTYVGDAVRAGPANAAQQCQLMAQLLDASMAEPWAGQDLCSQWTALRGELAKVEAGYAETQACKRLVTELVRRSEGRRTAAFETRLREALRALNEVEFAPVAGASKLLPF